MDDIATPILATVREDQESQIPRALVTAISGNSVQIRLLDSATPNPNYWPRAAASTWPLVIGDEVIVLRSGGGYVVLDKLVR